LYPYGDTRADTRPIYADDGDERAARRTLRFLAVALFVAVVGATLVVSLKMLEDEAPTSTASRRVQTVTTLPPPPEVGPKPGTEVAGYVAGRKSALAGVKDERVAVVSLAKYQTQTQARTLAGTTPVVALLVAPPGVAPATVSEDLAAWVKAQTDATRVERDEIRKLIPTTDDPAFKTFYTQEADRLDKALKNFDPASAMVFGLVVKGPAPALQALGAKAEVRLVDVADTATVDPKAVYRGLRPEETAKANEPPLRPV
jgi:hypothetical protein